MRLPVISISRPPDRLNDPGEGPIIRTEEWTGAIEWDTDLYAAAEAAP